MKFLLLSFVAIGLFAQPCLQQGSISTVSASAGIDNTSTLCTNWTLIIQTVGPIASYSAALQGDFGSGFVNMTATTGTNPCTVVTRCTVTYVGVAPNTVRVNVTAFTSVPAGGSLAYGLSGSSPITPTSGSIIVNGQVCALGGSCTISTAPSGAAGGDLSGTYPNPGVAKVNGNTPGGTCSAGQFVSSVNSSGIPTCGTPSGGGAISQIGKCVTGGSCSGVCTQTATTVTCAAIPGTANNLQIWIQARGDTAGNTNAINLQFNGDTGANYEFINNSTLGISSTSAGQTVISSCVLATAGMTANFAAECFISIPNYAGTTFNKQVHISTGSRFNPTGPVDYEAATFGNWNSTSAITQISIAAAAGNFVAGSTFVLYSLN